MEPKNLTREESLTYRAAASRARTAYLKKNGTPSLAVTDGRTLEETRAMLTEHATSWHAEHDGPMADAAHRAGMNAARKLNRDRVKRLETFRAKTIGTPRPDFLATLEDEAATAAARLEVLTAKPAKTSTRKPAKVRKLTAAPDAVETPTAPEVTVSAPETVPAPMPPMTRAARKQTRREIAAKMRAEGVKPEGQAWRDACAAAGLPVRDEVSA